MEQLYYGAWLINIRTSRRYKRPGSPGLFATCACTNASTIAPPLAIDVFSGDNIGQHLSQMREKECVYYFKRFLRKEMCLGWVTTLIYTVATCTRIRTNIITFKYRNYDSSCFACLLTATSIFLVVLKFFRYQISFLEYISQYNSALLGKCFYIFLL